MTPLYVALALGYLSVRCLRTFNSVQCNAINRFNCYFIAPFFTCQFISGVDPYSMNCKFLGGDLVAKSMVGLALFAWSKCRKGNLAWAITSFSLSSFNNTLVVGVPLLKAMYGAVGEDLVVQSSVIQALIWFPILLFLLEYRRTSASTVVRGDEVDGDDSTNGVQENGGGVDGEVAENDGLRSSSPEMVTVAVDDQQEHGGGVDGEVAENDRVGSSSPEIVTVAVDVQQENGGGVDGEVAENNNISCNDTEIAYCTIG